MFKVIVYIHLRLLPLYIFPILYLIKCNQLIYFSMENVQPIHPMLLLLIAFIYSFLWVYLSVNVGFFWPRFFLFSAILFWRIFHEIYCSFPWGLFLEMLLSYRKVVAISLTYLPLNKLQPPHWRISPETFLSCYWWISTRSCCPSNDGFFFRSCWYRSGRF